MVAALSPQNQPEEIQSEKIKIIKKLAINQQTSATKSCLFIKFIHIIIMK
jgi:hypothetical protein